MSNTPTTDPVQTAYKGEEMREPPKPIPVRARFYLTKCPECGWVGSSEQCGVDYGCDDSDVYCPVCDAPGCEEDATYGDCAQHGEAVMQRIITAEANLIALAKMYGEVCGELAALRSTPEGGDQGAWRPIESAPKDGTHILITRPSEWREDRHHVVAWGDWMAGRADEWWLVHDGKEDHPLRGPDPTHWMPLPSPLPTQSNTGGHREGA